MNIEPFIQGANFGRTKTHLLLARPFYAGSTIFFSKINFDKMKIQCVKETAVGSLSRWRIKTMTRQKEISVSGWKQPRISSLLLLCRCWSNDTGAHTNATHGFAMILNEDRWKDEKPTLYARRIWCRKKQPSATRHLKNIKAEDKKLRQSYQNNMQFI